MSANYFGLYRQLSRFYDADHNVVYRLKCYDSPSLADPEQGPGLWPMVDGAKVLFGEEPPVDPWEDGTRVDWCVEVDVNLPAEYFASYVEAADYLCSHLESFEAVEDTDNE